MRTIRIAAMAGLALLALDIAPARADVIECGRVSRFCREIIPIQCLKAAGAGSMPAPTGQAAELCESILGSYRSCLALVTGECRAGPPAETQARAGEAGSGGLGARDSLFGEWRGAVTCADGRSWVVSFVSTETVGRGANGRWIFSGASRGESAGRLVPNLNEPSGLGVLLITEDGGVYHYNLTLKGPDTMTGSAIRQRCTAQLER